LSGSQTFPLGVLHVIRKKAAFIHTAKQHNETLHKFSLNFSTNEICPPTEFTAFWGCYPFCMYLGQHEKSGA